MDKEVVWRHENLPLFYIDYWILNCIECVWRTLLFSPCNLLSTTFQIRFVRLVTQSYSARCMFSHDPSPPDAHLCTLCLPMALLKHCFIFALILQLVSSFYIRVYFRTISNLLYALHCSYSEITLYDITLNTSWCGVIVVAQHHIYFCYCQISRRFHWEHL